MARKASGGRPSEGSPDRRLHAGYLEALVSQAASELIRDEERLPRLLRESGLAPGEPAHAVEAVQGRQRDLLGLVARIDPALTKAIARARTWFESIASGRVTSFAEIASEEGMSDRYVGKLMPLAFLSPSIVEAVLAGDGSVELTAEAITSRIEIPASWTTQKSMLRP